MLLVAPRLLPALARTGWNPPAVSPVCQLVVPVVAKLPTLAGLNSFAWSVSAKPPDGDVGGVPVPQ